MRFALLDPLWDRGIGMLVQSPRVLVTVQFLIVLLTYINIYHNYGGVGGYFVQVVKSRECAKYRSADF